jgi:hypothetical protein
MAGFLTNLLKKSESDKKKKAYSSFPLTFSRRLASLRLVLLLPRFCDTLIPFN